MFRVCCRRIAGLWCFHIALDPVDCILMLSFMYLDILAVWLILMAEGFLRKVGRAMGQTMKSGYLTLLGRPQADSTVQSVSKLDHTLQAVSHSDPTGMMGRSDQDGISRAVFHVG